MNHISSKSMASNLSIYHCPEDIKVSNFELIAKTLITYLSSSRTVWQ